jgi:hypothetical protein
MRTIEEVNNDINALLTEKVQIEDSKLNETIYGMFSVMTKEEVLTKIGEMMSESPMIKMEVKRLLVDIMQER